VRVPVIRRPTKEIALRVIADVVIINLALACAVLGRYLWLVGVQGTEYPHAELLSAAGTFWRSFWILTVIAIACFSFSGFYTRNRAYRGRYKVVGIVQAVSIAYGLFLAIEFLADPWLALPRSVIVIGWALTLILVLTARLFTDLWRQVVAIENRRLIAVRPPTRIQSVLVIGGDGYIGSALLPMLLQQGYYVRVLSLLLFGTEPIDDLLHNPNLEVVRADFRQVDKVVQAMRGMDAVIHLGAIVGDPACALDPELTLDVNVTATKMIAEVAKGHGIMRFIFASTCSVYGASDELVNERSGLHPVSLYARSKMACERILEDMNGDGFCVTSLRFGTIYGLSGRTRFDLVVNLLTARAVTEGQIPVVGGEQWRPFVHVEDAARAILGTLNAPVAMVSGQIYNVGSNDQNMTIRQVGQLIALMVPSAIVTETVQAIQDRRNYRVSFAKIERQLGFVPRWSLEQGVMQVITALGSGRITDYRDARYSNVKFLSEESTMAGLWRPAHEEWLARALADGPSGPRERASPGHAA
jgi:nucleoside-diphosphate-sugar epimerase